MIAVALEDTLVPEAVERALMIYQQLSARDHSAIVQARKALTERIYGMVNGGEQDQQRLVVGGLAHLKMKERELARC